MSTPHESAVSSFIGSWTTSLLTGAYSLWHWFVGDASGLSILLGLSSLALAGIKIAQEIRAWQARDEERQVLRILWQRMSRKSRLASLDSSREER